MLEKRPAKPFSISIRLLAAPLFVACVASVVSLDSPRVLSQERASATESWTDSTGVKTIKAEFVKLDGVNVSVRMSDGTEKVIPLSKLDDKSRLKAREMAKSGARPSTSSNDASKNSNPVTFPSSPAAQEFMDIIVRELNNENPMVLWDALPASKQKQVQEIVKLAATRIEQRTLNAIKKFRGDLMTALKSKKSFILNSKQIPIPPDQKSVLEGSYDSLVALIEALIPEGWMDASHLQQVEVREMLATYADELNRKREAVENSLPSSSPFRAMLKKTPGSVKVENATAKDAIVTFMVPGQPEVPWKFVLTEGRWWPEPIIASWDQGLEQAKSTLQQINPKDIHKTVSQGLLAAYGVLGTLSSAETQEDFDDAFTQVEGMAQGMSQMKSGQK